MKTIEIKDGKLYTPVAGYRRGGTTVTFIGTIHIGTPRYYEELQHEIDRHAAGFYEGVRALRNSHSIPPGRSKYIALMNDIPGLNEAVARYSGFVTQNYNLKYGESWECNDVTLEEFIAYTSPIFLESLRVASAFKRCLDAVEQYRARNPREFSRIMRGYYMTTFRLPKLGLDELVFRFDKRDRRLHDALQSRLDEGADDIAVCYGSGHLPCLDRYLRSSGFARESKYWAAAWEKEEDEPSVRSSLWTILKDVTKKEKKEKKD